jgi:hypothetical protein
MKKLPPTLLVALATEVLSILVFGIREMLTSPDHWSISISLATTGMAIVTYVLGISGLLELAKRTTGRTNAGLRLAAAGFVLGLADMAFWLVFTYVQPHWNPDTLDRVQQWSWFAINLVPVLGLVIAAWDRDRRTAVIGLVVLLIADPLPPLARPMYGWIGHSYKAMMGLENGLRLVEVIVLFVLACCVAQGEPARAPDTATAGLRTIASALWLRVVAAVSVASLTMMMMLGSPGEGSVGILKLAMLAGAVINAISLMMMTRGAIAASRAGVVDLPRAPLALGAAAAAWCVGVALYQLPYMFRLLYGDPHGDFSFESSSAQDYVQALALAMPLVATAAIAAVAVAISGFASRRGLEQLRADAQGKGAAFVVLMLVSIGLQVGLLPKADTLSGFALMTIGAAVCSLWATVVMARLCATAADSLRAEPGLPTAKVV